MMIDTKNVFSDKQTINGSTTTSSAVVDCGQALNTTGLGDSDLCVVVMPTEDFVGTGTLTVHIQDCDTESGSYRNIISHGPVAVADFKPMFVRMPMEHKRYMRVVYTASGALTAGKMFSAMTDSIQAQQFYKAQDYSFQ